MILIFDTETTGLPQKYDAPVTDTENWPRLVQIAWQLHAFNGKLMEYGSCIIKPEGFTIPLGAEQMHGISQERALEEGIPLKEAVGKFLNVIEKAHYYAGHNLDFDLSILGCEWYRLGMGDFPKRRIIDTKSDPVTEFCALPGGKGGKFKWPKLEEVYLKLFGSEFENAHNAAFDVAASGKVLFELIKMGILAVPECEEVRLRESIKYEAPDLRELKEHEVKWKNRPRKKIFDSSSHSVHTISPDEFPFFNSFHNHTQFSILNSTMELEDLIEKASQLGSDTLAITDEGNMFGCFLFGQAVEKYNKKVEEYHQTVRNENHRQSAWKKEIKPVFGTEIRICRNHKDKSVKDDGYTIVLLAKNKKGYQNISKLSSISFTEGFYYYPRIDKELLKTYKEGVIVLSGWLHGEIPSLILQKGEEVAEKSLMWYKKEFGEDFYLEIHRHGLEEEEVVNEVLFRFSEKHSVPVLAAHQNYYLSPEDHEIHDLLLCIRDGEKVSTPVGRTRGTRYGLPNRNFFFPDKKYIYERFKDIPQAVLETQKLAGKIEKISLQRDILLPRFEIPQDFLSGLTLDAEDPNFEKKAENAYLRHLTYEGASERYGELTVEIKERIEYELSTIERMGYPGYFLIVQDITKQARKMGVVVGPGRGSAAGSVIAYCLGITNIDPIRYQLLFERFLNPDRISMPDIDIDFDDDGREKILEYVIRKYGYNRVAQIITYGTLGGRSALRDVARVLDYPLQDADRLAKSFPVFPGSELKKILYKDGIHPKLLEDIKERTELLEQCMNFRKAAEQQTPDGKIIRMAARIEGSLRNTGVHACGVIITPGEITDYVPVTRSKESSMLLTQYDNSVAENAGLLKMDFLGLKTLTIIRDAIRFIKENHSMELDIDSIPLDDKKTYEIFQKGLTNGIFQFESQGMQKYLKELKPDSLTDLIAMNALYRPGPLQYIPQFIRRKHGQEPISYLLPEMEEYLKETFGITVYQEQVMLLAQKLAGFSKGDADTLRKAMGKKQKDTLAKMKDKFMKGCSSKGHPSDVCEKIWKDWEFFASYAFNKSHSTCYAYLAYQTAYLKAHYPSEFMASILNHHKDIKDIAFFLEECQRMGIKVFGPDINESGSKFMVMKDGSIRFGLSAIKGVGENVIQLIVDERIKNGNYRNIFDFARRHDTKVVNKKTLEHLAQAGTFDSLGVKRSMFFMEGDGKNNLTDTLIKFCQQHIRSKSSMTRSLFGENSSDYGLLEPSLPDAEEWPMMLKLKKEKELVGFYLSGHPLNNYRWILERICHTDFATLAKRKQDFFNREILVAGMVEKVEPGNNRNGDPYLKIIMIDKSEEPLEHYLRRNELIQFQHFFKPDMKLLLKIRITPSTFDPNRFNVQILSVDPLDAYQEKMNCHVRFKIPLKSFTRDFSLRFENLIKQFPGKNTFELIFYDEETRREYPLVKREPVLGLGENFFQQAEELADCKIEILMNGLIS